MRSTALCLLVTLIAAVCLGQSGDSQNPVTDTSKRMLGRYSKNIVAAAEQMPADKYSYKPTDGQQTFGHILSHIAESNFTLCSAIGGASAPESKVGESDPKDKIVKVVKDSFDFCSQALDKLNDSQLGQEVTLFGGRKGPKAAAVIALDMDFADHYSAMAGYLRMNGMLPPSAQQQAKPAEKK